MDLAFTINNQILKRTDRKEVVNLSENYLKLDFDFSSDWDTVDKYILIYHGKKVTRLALVNDSVTLSSQFLKSNRFVFTVYGEIIEDEEVVYRITTNPLQINLIESRFTTDYDGRLDPVEDADVVEQLWSAINLKADESDVPVVVDTVADGNTDAVSSNAVYDYVTALIGNANNWLTQ